MEDQERNPGVSLGEYLRPARRAVYSADLAGSYDDAKQTETLPMFVALRSSSSCKQSNRGGELHIQWAH
jgi:hypothetical protein